LTRRDNQTIRRPQSNGVNQICRRQSNLANDTASDNHHVARPPLLILIDAPLSSRLSRYSLPVDLARQWPERFMGAIAPGADLSRVHWHLLHWLLTTPSVNPGIEHPLVRDAVKGCADLIADLAAGKAPNESAAWSAAARESKRRLAFCLSGPWHSEQRRISSGSISAVKSVAAIVRETRRVPANRAIASGSRGIFMGSGMGSVSGNLSSKARLERVLEPRTTPEPRPERPCGVLPGEARCSGRKLAAPILSPDGSAGAPLGTGSRDGQFKFTRNSCVRKMASGDALPQFGGAS
jgi:hypothetical protein